jgi:hypothetical protein
MLMLWHTQSIVYALVFFDSKLNNTLKQKYAELSPSSYSAF